MLERRGRRSQGALKMSDGRVIWKCKSIVVDRRWMKGICWRKCSRFSIEGR